MSERVTVCIPLHHGGGKYKNDTELRLVLRSLTKHFKGKFDVVIIGPKKPEWLQNARHLVQTMGGLKTTLVMASEAYPDGFFWWYDDCLLIKDQTAEELKRTPTRKEIDPPKSTWGHSLAKIKTRLMREGLPALDYSLPHGPYWFDRSMVKEGLVDWPGMKDKFPWETWILNKRRWPSRLNVAHNTFRPGPSPGPDKIFWNFSDGAFDDALLAHFTSIFPAMSRYEKESGMPEEVEEMPYQILVGICSCVAYKDKRDACRETWASKDQPELRRVFFAGRGASSQGEDDLIVLDADDSYRRLPEKVMAFFKWALQQPHWKWLMKCDDDSYVDFSRVPVLVDGADENDVIGFMCRRKQKTRFMQGGAGYLLHRSMVQKILDRGVAGRGWEDLYISNCAWACGGQAKEQNHRMDHKNTMVPRRDNQVISSHRFTPQQLRAAHAIRHGKEVMRFTAHHSRWRDEIIVYEHKGARGFVRAGSNCAGLWKENELHWFSWDAEMIASRGDGSFSVVPYQSAPWEWSRAFDRERYAFTGGSRYQMDECHIDLLYQSVHLSSHRPAGEKIVVEIGSMHGASTAALLTAVDQEVIAQLHVVELYPTDTLKRALEHCLFPDRVTLHTVPFWDLTILNPDLVFIDGDHQFPAFADLSAALTCGASTIVMHDTQAAHYPKCWGSIKAGNLLKRMSGRAWFEDAEHREGMDTQRGFLVSVPEGVSLRLLNDLVASIRKSGSSDASAAVESPVIEIEAESTAQKEVPKRTIYFLTREKMACHEPMLKTLSELGTVVIVEDKGEALPGFCGMTEAIIGKAVTAYDRAFQLMSGDEAAWLIEDDVTASAEILGQVMDAADAASVDLCATDFCLPAGDRKWPHWDAAPNLPKPVMRAFTQLCRLSPALIREIHARREMLGHHEHHELSFATLAKSRLNLRDLVPGAFGSFRWRPALKGPNRHGKIVHPVKFTSSMQSQVSADA